MLAINNNGKAETITTTGPDKRLVEISNLDEFDGYADGLRAGDVVKARVTVGGGDYIALGGAYIRKLVREWADAVGVTLYAVEIIRPKRAQEKRPANQENRTDEELVREYAGKMGEGRATIAAGLKIVEARP